MVSILERPRTDFDAIVDVGGGPGAHFAAIQDADDLLDSGAYRMLVKSGSYAGFTVSTNSAYIFIEPGSTITSAITLSGTDITWSANSDLTAAQQQTVEDMLVGGKKFEDVFLDVLGGKKSVEQRLTALEV